MLLAIKPNDLLSYWDINEHSRELDTSVFTSFDEFIQNKTTNAWYEVPNKYIADPINRKNFTFYVKI